MKKFLSVTLILALALTLCFSFVACNGQNVKIVEIDYSTVLADYLKYPDATNVASMNSISRNVAEILADDSLSDSEKIASAMYRSIYNEIDCEYFAYFIDRVGETKLNNNHGQLVYQRLRRQSDKIKDDWTLKLPVNHNFIAEAMFVTSADIRYVTGGKYYRMSNKSDIVYNEKTGLLEVETWKKQKSSNWNRDENAKDSRSYAEARKTCINWKVEGIVKSEGAKIESKTDDNGNKYYELTFSIDVAKANADNASFDDKKTENSTIGMLENDNGGKGMKYEYCDLVVQIWECGLAKQYYVNESWSGTIQSVYKGSAQSVSKIVFSYSMADQDDSVTASIKAGIK
ncbi:MAG: hypothetical protein K2L52_04715 [Clostridia bacterium]|nr:hypothetical protein [Clostridia bacterium]